MKYKIKIVFFLLMLSAFNMQARINYAGKDFWITLGGFYISSTFGRGVSVDGLLNIGSKHTATVTLYFTNTGMTQTYIIPADSVVTIPFTNAMCNAVSNFSLEQVDNKSLHITSDSDIVVDYFDKLVKSSDGTTVLPTDNQIKADSFLLLSVPGQIIQNAPLDRMYPFSIVATCDTVDVTITPVKTTYRHPAGIPFTVRLYKGQTYQLGTDTLAGPTLTGTKIKVDASCCQTPVNIFHHMLGYYADIKGGAVCCQDYPLEQVLPANYYDTAYPVVTWARNAFCMLRIYSAAGNNRVYFDNFLVRTMAKGEVFDTLITNAAIMVHAAKPISLGQFMLSNSALPNQPTGDPEIMYNTSTRQGIRESLFSTVHVMAPAEPGWHYLTIMSRKKNVASITLNGQNISSYFKNFYLNPEWQYAYVPLLPNLTYHLKSDDKVVAYYYFLVGQGSYSHNLPDIIIDSQLLNGGLSLVAKTDTLYRCIGASVTLSANAADIYEWNTGANTQQISVTDQGYYSVKETHLGPCVNPYQHHGFYVVDDDTTTLYDHAYDTIYKCSGSIVLIAAEAESYRWSTGDITQQIDVAETGIYSVISARAISPCRQSVTTKEYYVDSKALDKQLDIGNDTTMCPGDFLILTTNIGKAQWSTGEVSPSILVTEAGIYKATIIDSCDNVHTDSVMIYIRPCSKDAYCNVNFPTAFTPNADGRNDVFRAIGFGTYNSYYITIYDRWGTLLFDARDAKAVWDGTYHEKPMPGGVYMYMCTVDCSSTGKVIFKGDITLIR